MILGALLLLGPGVTVHAQDAPVAVLVYADDMREVEVLDFTGEVVEGTDYGSELLIGFGLRTGNTTAELQFEPNGSLLRVNTDTFLKIEELQGLSNTQVNSAALVQGKMRVVAARVTGQNYRVRTPSAAFGVRGTDFVLSVDENRETTVVVDEGAVDVFNPRTGATEQVAAGEALTAREETLARIDREMDAVSRLLQEAEFVTADPANVPRSAADGYTTSFDYFQEYQREAYLEFFADDDFFEDYREYMERFRSYYESEMERFQEILEREEQAVREQRQEAEGAGRREQDAFEEWQQRN
jgi:hypothetical protein